MPAAAHQRSRKGREIRVGPPFIRQDSGSLLVKAVFVLVGVPVGSLGLYWYLTFPNVAVLAKKNPSSTALMDARTAETKAPGPPRKPFWVWVPLARISPHLQRAVIVAEDTSFFRHHGFDWDGIRDAATRNLDRGEFRRGGSTITQQLAKNLYLSPQKNLVRKAREAFIARALEQRLTKRRILELYLNVVEWGHGIYGAEAAARHYFRKSAQDLTPADAAWLAAILPSPRRYDPLRTTAYLSRRQHQILRRMQEETVYVPIR
jgi:monofunctional biosynthetic peptidoglycan transglycosylase